MAWQPNVSFHGKASTSTQQPAASAASPWLQMICQRIFPPAPRPSVVDYDYVSINAHDYLMPVSAEVSLLEGRHEAMLNTIDFRNYKRFGSNMKILNYKPVEKP